MRILILFLVFFGLGGKAHATPGAQIITLADAISIALERNNALRQAHNGAEISALQVRQARMSFVPTLSVSAAGLRTHDSGPVATVGIAQEPTTNSLRMGASTRLVLFNGMRDWAQLKIAKLGHTASALDLERLQETTVLTVIAQYLDLTQSRRQFSVQQENLTAATELMRQIEIYVETGGRPRADLYTQESTVARARLALMDAQREIELAQVQLINTLQLDSTAQYEFQAPEAEANAALQAVALAGEDAEAGPSATESQDASFNLNDSADLQALIQQALAQRKDVQAKEAQTEAVERRIPLARPSRWPTLSVYAGYGSHYWDPPDLGLQEQLDQNRSGSVSLAVDVPIYTFDSDRYATRIARLQFENSKIALQEARQAVELEVKSAWLSYNSARAQYKVIEVQQKAAKLALDTANERYQIGAATLVELSQARATYQQSESALVNARYNLLFQSMALDYYTGNLQSDAARAVKPRSEPQS